MLLFSDEDYLVVDKPPLSLVIPGRRGDRRVLKTELEAEHGRLWVVHRLDWGVGGVLLFARNADAHRHASQAFEHREVTKRYEALTCGIAPEGEQLFRFRLKRGKKRAYVHEQGKKALTVANATQEGERVRWALSPQTGRNHQLRVHLMTAGFPIVGDALYGSEVPRENGLALWSVHLSGAGLPTVDLPSGGRES